MKRSCLLPLFAVFATALPLHAQPLPVEMSTLFAGSGVCQTCHAASGDILFEGGEDISPVTQWRSTMMGNSSKDPLWRAMVSEEVSLLPHLQEIIESRCTNCHAPLGYAEAIHGGSDSYSMAELQSDPLANDGVSCTLCHQIQSTNWQGDESWSGGFLIEELHEIYGPYEEPLTMPMMVQSGYTPVQAEAIAQSELCGTCHTLFTPYVDNDGEVAGMFAEQTPYLEWLNSRYPGEGSSCQSCHMPQAQQAHDIAVLPPWHDQQRAPFYQHWFVGGNTYTLELLGEHGDALGVTATEEQIQATRDRAVATLASALELTLDGEYGDGSLTLDVTLTNLTGHKLPTGIPLRRMWLHVVGVNDEGEVVFESGAWDEAGQINGVEGYQVHHNLIAEPEQVQVYEGVLGDVDGQQTYTLLRAASFLKDNRLLPKEWQEEGPHAETTAPVGLAVDDEGFHDIRDGQSGGDDRIRYQMRGATGATVQVCYQVVTHELIEHLEELDTPEINQFTDFADALPPLPQILAEASLQLSDAPESEFQQPQTAALLPNWPNPFNGETVIRYETRRPGQISLDIINIRGQVVEELFRGGVGPGEHRLPFQAAHLAAGLYYCRLRTETGQVAVQPMLYLR